MRRNGKIMIPKENVTCGLILTKSPITSVILTNDEPKISPLRKACRNGEDKKANDKAFYFIDNRDLNRTFDSKVTCLPKHNETSQQEEYLIKNAHVLFVTYRK